MFKKKLVLDLNNDPKYLREVIKDLETNLRAAAPDRTWEVRLPSGVTTRIVAFGMDYVAYPPDRTLRFYNRDQRVVALFLEWSYVIEVAS